MESSGLPAHRSFIPGCPPPESERGSPPKVTRSVANRTAWRDEQGALLVLTAILVPAIVLLGALTFGITSLWTSHDDVQRGVDLGSTAAAAATPTAAVTPGAATLP